MGLSNVLQDSRLLVKIQLVPLFVVPVHVSINQGLKQKHWLNVG